MLLLPRLFMYYFCCESNVTSNVQMDQQTVFFLEKFDYFVKKAIILIHLVQSQYDKTVKLMRSISAIMLTMVFVLFLPLLANNVLCKFNLISPDEFVSIFRLLVGCTYTFGGSLTMPSLYFFR